MSMFTSFSTITAAFDEHARTGAPSRRVPTLRLYTGTDCQLCDVAKGVLDSIAREVRACVHPRRMYCT